MSGDGFRLIGSLCLGIKIKFNSIEGFWDNNLKFELVNPLGKTIQSINLLLAPFSVSGTIWGERCFNYTKRAIFIDKAS